MEYRTVGRTGIKVSNLAYGAMSFGGDADEAMSEQLFNRALEAGINFFDTADMYSNGRSEEILGRLMQGKRDDLVITSKVFFPVSNQPSMNGSGLSRKHMQASIDGSLKRLKTDYIDFYMLHYFDEQTDLELVLRTLDDFQKQGKILYPGVSNWAAWQIMDALGVSERELLARFEIIEPIYNVAKRQAEAELLPLARAKNLGVTPYSVLGAGLLTGKYGKNRQPDSGRLIESKVNRQRYINDLELADRFTDYANEIGVNPTTLAVAWVASHPAVTSAIVGGRNVSQLETSLAAADFNMTPEIRAEIDALSQTPEPANGRTEELTLGTFKSWDQDKK